MTRRLADEQAALRRVATLVAAGAPSAEVFAGVAHEVAQVLRLPNAGVCRFDDDGTVPVVIFSTEAPSNGSVFGLAVSAGRAFAFFSVSVLGAGF